MKNTYEQPSFKKLQTTPSTLKDCDEISIGTTCQIAHPSIVIFIYKIIICLYNAFFNCLN